VGRQLTNHSRHSRDYVAVQFRVFRNLDEVDKNVFPAIPRPLLSDPLLRHLGALARPSPLDRNWRGFTPNAPKIPTTSAFARSTCPTVTDNAPANFALHQPNGRTPRACCPLERCALLSLPKGARAVGSESGVRRRMDGGEGSIQIKSF
jgi:hypothetical protein